MVKFAEYFCVSIDYLIYDKGNIFLPVPKKESYLKNSNSYILKSKLKYLLSLKEC